MISCVLDAEIQIEMNAVRYICSLQVEHDVFNHSPLKN